MTESEFHDAIVARLSAIEGYLMALNRDMGAVKQALHMPGTCSIKAGVMSLESAVKTLEREQDQARGGLRVGLALVALLSVVASGVAALIAIFRN